MKLLFVILTALASFLTGLETRTLRTDFTVTITENATQPLNLTGTITVHGTQFLLSALDYEAAYDGKTLFLWQPEIEELTLSTPTEQELLETNPFLFAKALNEAGKKVDFVIDDKNLPVRAQMVDGKTMYTIIFRNPQYITMKVDYVIIPPEGAYINDLR